MSNTRPTLRAAFEAGAGCSALLPHDASSAATTPASATMRLILWSGMGSSGEGGRDWRRRRLGVGLAVAAVAATAGGAASRASGRRLVDRRRPRPATQLVATPAAGLVEVLAAHHDPAAAALLPVGPVRGATAYHADRERLGDVLGDREQLGHGLERPPGVVLIEPGDDHPLASPGQPLAHPDQLGAQELPL